MKSRDFLLRKFNFINNHCIAIRLKRLEVIPIQMIISELTGYKIFIDDLLEYFNTQSEIKASRWYNILQSISSSNTNDSLYQSCYIIAPHLVGLLPSIYKSIEQDDISHLIKCSAQIDLIINNVK